jgi:hypothetical protein
VRQTVGGWEQAIQVGASPGTTRSGAIIEEPE